MAPRRNAGCRTRAGRPYSLVMRYFSSALCFGPLALALLGGCDDGSAQGDGAGGGGASSATGGSADGGDSSGSGGASSGGTSTGSGGSASGSGGSNGGQPAAVGKADPFELDGDSTTQEVLAVVVGTYPVVVYKAPTLEEVGLGALTVRSEGGNVSFALEGPGGVIADVSVPEGDSSCGDGICIQLSDSWTTPLGGRRLALYDYYAEEGQTNVLVEFHPDGYLTGNASGRETPYHFRNDVLAYGTAVPGVFATLAGEYEGPNETNTCLPNPIGVSVTAAGEVTVRGKSSLSCAAQELELTWDGQDDLIVPSPDGARLLLDSTHIGGSQPGGGITLQIPNATDAEAFTHLTTNFAGAHGHITVPDPVKQ